MRMDHPTPLSAEAHALLEEIRRELGPIDYEEHASAWRAKAREDMPTLRAALARLRSRPPVPPLRNKGAWMANTYHRIREDGVNAERAGGPVL